MSRMLRHKNSRVLGVVAALALALGATSSARVSAETETASRPATPLVSAVSGVEVVVSELNRSRPFFESIGFVFEGEDEPRGGRPTPQDVRANDLIHWQILVDTSDTAAFVGAAAATGGRTVSQATLGPEALVRDRDGHALLAHDSRGIDEIQRGAQRGL